MKSMIGAFAVSILVSGAAARAEPDHAAEQKALYPAVRTFLGGLRGGYVLPDSPVYQQVGEAMSGPYGADIPIPEGGRIINACRLHSCEEMAAVAVDNERRVRAIGLISFRCRRVRLRNAAHVTCDDAPTLTIFTHPGEPAYFSKYIETWGRSMDGPNLRIADVAVR